MRERAAFNSKAPKSQSLVSNQMRPAFVGRLMASGVGLVAMLTLSSCSYSWLVVVENQTPHDLRYMSGNSVRAHVDAGRTSAPVAFLGEQQEWTIRTDECVYTYAGPQFDKDPAPPEVLEQKSQYRSRPSYLLRVDSQFVIHAFSLDRDGTPVGPEIEYFGFPLQPSEVCG